MSPDKLERIAEFCVPHGLTILGGFHPHSDDGAPEGTKTLLMIGPDAGFWEVFTVSPEMIDGQKDPLDRWSLRVLSEIATQAKAEAVFPFGGPPYAPFISWALRSGQCFTSPVGLLVHAHHGLMVSFRGALALTEHVSLPASTSSPCNSCSTKPCLNACPAGVLTRKGYDVPGCHAYLRSSQGQPCKTEGCKVRRACPIDGSRRNHKQSGFHMSAFQGE